MVLQARDHNAVYQRAWGTDIARAETVFRRDALRLAQDDAVRGAGRHGLDGVDTQRLSHSIVTLPFGSAVVSRMMATLMGTAL